MKVSKEELAAKRDDNGEFYVTIHCMGAIFRLYKPNRISDIIEAAKKVQRMDDRFDTNALYVAMYKGFELPPNSSINGLGIPRGAMIEVSPLGILLENK